MIMNISVRSCFLSNSEGKGRRLCFWLWRQVRHLLIYLVFLKGNANGKTRPKRIKKIRGDYKLFFFASFGGREKSRVLISFSCSPTS